MTYSRLIALALVGLATACATPMPTEQLAVANSAVERAERAGAAEYAAAELATARDKLQRASNGANSHSMTASQVAFLAQEAEADAKLAEAETQSGKAKAAVATTQEDLRAIQEEAQRAADAPAVPQPTPSMAP
jgi:uncharacterized protein DUF4398